MASRALLLLALVVSLSAAYAARDIEETPFGFDLDGNTLTFRAVPSDSVGLLPQLHRAFASRAVTLQIETGTVSVEIWSTTADDVNCNKIDAPQEPATPVEETEAPDSNVTETTACPAAPVPPDAAVPVGPAASAFHYNATCAGRSCLYILNPNVVHCFRLHSDEVVKGTIVGVAQTRFIGVFVLLLLGLNVHLARKANQVPDCRAGGFYKIASFLLVCTFACDLFHSAPELAAFFQCECVKLLVRVLAGGVVALSVASWCAAKWTPERRAWSTLDLGQLCGIFVTFKWALLAVRYWSLPAQMVTASFVLLFGLIVYKKRRVTHHIRGSVENITKSEYEKLDQEELAKIREGKGDVAAWYAACSPDKLMERFENDPDRYTIPAAAPSVKSRRRAADATDEQTPKE